MDSWLIDQAIYTSDREKRQYIPRSYILQKSPPLIVKNANSKLQF